MIAVRDGGDDDRAGGNEENVWNSNGCGCGDDGGADVTFVRLIILFLMVVDGYGGDGEDTGHSVYLDDGGRGGWWRHVMMAVTMMC